MTKLNMIMKKVIFKIIEHKMIRTYSLENRGSSKNSLQIKKKSFIIFFNIVLSQRDHMMKFNLE